MTEVAKLFIESIIFLFKCEFPPAEIDNLLGSIIKIDKNASVYLFGSRTDDQKKGGDIDIAILSKLVNLKEKLEIKYNFYQVFGEQKLDLLIVSDENMAFGKLLEKRLFC